MDMTFFHIDFFVQIVLFVWKAQNKQKEAILKKIDMKIVSSTKKYKIFKNMV